MSLFDDMMSSGRGPGVIGTLMALVVIIGFGTLYFFVFDEGMRGGDKSIESVIRDNTKEIDNLSSQVANRQKSLEKSPELSRIASETDETLRSTRNGRAEVDGQTAAIARTQGEFAANQEQFEKYRQSYREQLRAEGKGMTFPQLKTLSGKTYQQIVVKTVDPTGLSFQHSEGISRASFEDLSEEIRQRFQYDSEEAKKAALREKEIRDKHDAEVEDSITLGEKQNKETGKRRREEEVRKASAEVAALRGQLSNIDQNISDVRSKWARARENGGLINSALFQNQISELQTRRDAVNSRLKTQNDILGK